MITSSQVSLMFQSEMVDQDDESQVEEEDEKDSASHYDYLLGMTMWSLTKEKKDELLKKRDEKLQEVKILQAKTPEMLWKEDLVIFLEKVSSMTLILHATSYGHIYLDKNSQIWCSHSV